MNRISNERMLEVPQSLAGNRLGISDRSADFVANAIHAAGISADEIAAIDRRVMGIVDIGELVAPSSTTDAKPPIDMNKVRQDVNLAAPSPEDFDRWSRMPADPLGDLN